MLCKLIEFEGGADVKTQSLLPRLMTKATASVTRKIEENNVDLFRLTSTRADRVRRDWLGGSLTRREVLSLAEWIPREHRQLPLTLRIFNYFELH